MHLIQESLKCDNTQEYSVPGSTYLRECRVEQEAANKWQRESKY